MLQSSVVSWTKPLHKTVQKTKPFKPAHEFCYTSGIAMQAGSLTQRATSKVEVSMASKGNRPIRVRELRGGMHKVARRVGSQPGVRHQGELPQLSNRGLAARLRLQWLMKDDDDTAHESTGAHDSVRQTQHGLKSGTGKRMRLRLAKRPSIETSPLVDWKGCLKKVLAFNLANEITHLHQKLDQLDELARQGTLHSVDL